MILPGTLKSKIESEWTRLTQESAAISNVQACGGGCINQSARVTIGSKHVFLKFNTGVEEDFFNAEAIGLNALRNTETIKVPEVYLVGSESPEHPAYLVLETLIESPANSQTAVKFGEDLAALHRNSRAHYGFPKDNYIGSTKQRNTEHSHWIKFFRDCRLKTQFDWVCQDNSVDSSFKNNFETLLNRLDTILIPGEAPALIHGDLWSGNSMTVQGGRTAIFDPAAYYGHREADLAMTELFGRHPQSFYDAYDHAYPLEPGYGERRDLYNLYHMLNHWNLFGSSYRGSCERIIRSYVSE